MKRIALLIGPPLLVLCIMAILIAVHVPQKAPSVVIPSASASQEENRITPDGKNLLGLSDGGTQSRMTARLLSLPPVPKIIALTFDDGPHPQYTEQLLEILREREVRATFFMLGNKVEQYPNIAHLVSKAGHQVANHSYDHEYAQFSSNDLLRSNVEHTGTLIFNATGVYPTAFRPPGGLLTEDMDSLVQLPVVLWSVDSRDWEVRHSETILKNATAGVLPGDIILLHDIYGTTIESVPVIIDELRHRGFSFVTVQELLGLSASEEHAKGMHYFRDFSLGYENRASAKIDKKLKK